VECIPVNDVVDDNISVPLATMLAAYLLFGYSSCCWDYKISPFCFSCPEFGTAKHHRLDLFLLNQKVFCSWSCMHFGWTLAKSFRSNKYKGLRTVSSFSLSNMENCLPNGQIHIWILMAVNQQTSHMEQCGESLQTKYNWQQEHKPTVEISLIFALQTIHKLAGNAN
jgi:hypothetical protein